MFDMCIPALYIIGMIRSFLHKGLKELLETRRTGKIRADLQKRAHVRLSALDNATNLQELNQPGFDFHPLKGKPQRYSIHVNGPWAITFEWQDGAAVRVDLEQYH
jgi:proteic killer suppression protein